MSALGLETIKRRGGGLEAGDMEGVKLDRLLPNLTISDHCYTAVWGYLDILSSRAGYLGSLETLNFLTHK